MNKLILNSLVFIIILLFSSVIFARGGYGNGAGTGQQAGGGTAVDIDISIVLTNQEEENLAFMREEEKLARDVYLFFYELWSKNTFTNIANAEQNHMDSVKVILDAYQLSDPAPVDRGFFTDPELQELYDQLIEQGKVSLIDALKVGALIEEVDIKDLYKSIMETDNPAIIQVYSQLINGSYNHLNAFVAQLSAQGISYNAQLLTQDEVNRILSGERFDIDTYMPSTPLAPIAEHLSGAFIAFGDFYGLWSYQENQWQKLHDQSADYLASADLDNNGQTDVIIDFGQSYGLWLYMNNSYWRQLHTVSSQGFRSGDIDADPADDIIIDFGSIYGLWLRMNNSSWSQLHQISPEHFIMADMDNNDVQELIVDFGSSYGLWIHHNSNGWKQLHKTSAKFLNSADIDGNGQDDVIIDFGPAFGIWVYLNNSSWQQLHASHSHIQPVSSDLDGNGQDDIVIDFGSAYGIWAWMNNSSWVQIHDSSAEQIVIRYLDNNEQADILIDFGRLYGLWSWENNSRWVKLHAVSPALMSD